MLFRSVPSFLRFLRVLNDSLKSSFSCASRLFDIRCAPSPSRVSALGPYSPLAAAAASIRTRINTPSHIFITKSLRTRTNIGPIRTSAERRIFYFELKRLRGHAPSNISRDQGSVNYLTWLFDKSPRWAQFCKALNGHVKVLRGEHAIAYHLPNQVVATLLSLSALTITWCRSLRSMLSARRQRRPSRPSADRKSVV